MGWKWSQQGGQGHQLTWREGGRSKGRERTVLKGLGSETAAGREKEEKHRESRGLEAGPKSLVGAGAEAGESEQTEQGCQKQPGRKCSWEHSRNRCEHGAAQG